MIISKDAVKTFGKFSSQTIHDGKPGIEWNFLNLTNRISKKKKHIANIIS